jgi:hypothetical protein
VVFVVFLLDFRTVPTAWYLLLDLGTVPTAWYLLLDFGAVPTAWYLLLDKQKNKKYHAVGTVPKSRQEIKIVTF